MNRQLLSMLGLCKRAGGLKTGGVACEKAVQSQKALLVIVSCDASQNTKKQFSQKTFYYNIPYREALTKNELGKAVGLSETAVIAVTNSHFSGKILELVEADSNSVPNGTKLS